MKGNFLRTSALWVRGLMLVLLSVSLVALFTEYAYAVTFAKTYVGVGWNWAPFIQQTSDGGYIVACGTDSLGVGFSDAFLVKTDANGNIIWAKTYGGTGYDWASSVQQTSDGGYIVAGWTSSFSAGISDAFLIKTDADGNIIWAKTYGGTDWDYAYSVQQTSDGGYILAGVTWSFGAGLDDIFLIKTDADGNIIWAKTYGGTDWDYAYSVQQTSDGGYIVAGWTSSFSAGISDAFLIKTDANGNVSWAKTYGGISDDYVYSVQQTSDGGYIVAGRTNSFGAGGDIFLFKTDANGNVQWAKIYGGTFWDIDYIASSVQQTSDGGYIVAGGILFFGEGIDILLIKTDANGDIGSCPAGDVIPPVTTPSPTVTTPSPSVSSVSPIASSVSPTVTSPTLRVDEPCPLSISESCQITRGIIMPYKGGIKVRGSGEFKVKVYSVSGVMVKSVKGKDEVKLELSRGVYFVEV
ncbi:hypothetical protein LM594_06185, partial [Candidatus Caldipriscus sp.]|nr:hypothetical protein [Candidatus Caldipriscus sp.]